MGEEVEEGSKASGKTGISGWVERRAHRVVSKLYEARADEIETRARRVVSSAYEESADDLEERAVRALRSALTLEAERIKEAVEHGVRVKKREVRLSLVVLIVAALVYLVLYWVTRIPPPT
jgi:vacuolar-type H+-ATPase subunit E/Vma4